MTNAVRILVFALTMLVAAPAWAQFDQEQTVNSALATIERMKTSQPSVREQINKARAVLIVPNFYKGGFILGGEYGNGVLLVRNPDGSWTYPAFYTMEGGTLGFQIGLQSTSVLFLIMSEKGLKAVVNNQFRFGADAGITVVIVSAGAGASTTSNLGADILAYSFSGMGLYAGMSLEGSVLAPRESWNAAYYGRDVTSRAILFEHAASNPQADRLRDFLAH